MEFLLRSLALAMFFLLGLCALAMSSELNQLHSLQTRQPQQLATCTYTASNIVTPTATRNSYSLLISLPGTQWGKVCLNSRTMRSILETIQLRCLRKWSQKDSRTRFDGSLEAILEDGQCRIRIRVITELEDDMTFPKFEDDCILDPKLESCGLETKHFPWPSMCFKLAVSL